MNVAKKLKLLRDEMHKKNIDIYIVPSTDAHNSEYVPKCWDRRAWISSFDGSAGEVIVTAKHAYLFTDGRYFLQAREQLDPMLYTLIQQSGAASKIETWLVENAKNQRIGIDPQLISIKRAQKLKQLIQDLSSELVILEDNLVDKCKSPLGEADKTSLAQAFALSEQYTGQSLTERLTMIRAALIKNVADFIALNVLDEIAWLFNIRGADIEYTPLVISYAILGQNAAWLFVDQRKIPASLNDILSNAGITILDYAQFGQHLGNLKGRIWLDARTANLWMLDKISAKSSVILEVSPILYKKALKNLVEAEGMRVAHIQDAVAVIRFLCWLQHNWQTGVDEISCADKLASFRAQEQHIVSASFRTISGFASNGAIIHYHATPATCKIVDDSNLYLIDSGGQYLEGTTDITRTIHLGKPRPEHKRHYTLVLKGHLALARVVFPHGMAGEHLDAFARAPLWHEYLNYRHGTGHGVGSFLCVHEGPQNISPAISGIALVPGMVVSNEPGFYLDGEYGIRIENLCLITEVRAKAAKSSEFGPFYQFENLTLVPYSKELIDLDLLSTEDKAQLKVYYTKINTKIRRRLGLVEQMWLDDQLALFN